MDARCAAPRKEKRPQPRQRGDTSTEPAAKIMTTPRRSGGRPPVQQANSRGQPADTQQTSTRKQPADKDTQQTSSTDRPADTDIHQTNVRSQPADTDAQQTNSIDQPAHIEMHQTSNRHQPANTDTQQTKNPKNAAQTKTDAQTQRPDQLGSNVPQGEAGGQGSPASQEMEVDGEAGRMAGTETQPGVDASSGDVEEQIIRQDVQAEVERVRRRSTFALGRKSCCSVGGRQSLAAAVPHLSLEDQIKLEVNSELPRTSRLARLLDVCLRETLHRLLAADPDDECLTDLRIALLPRTETIAIEVANDCANLPLDQLFPVTSASLTQARPRASGLEAWKQRTRELEQELRDWKLLMRQRKAACRAAESKFEEAKTGQWKIDETQKQLLTSEQRRVLSDRPNYQEMLQTMDIEVERGLRSMQQIQSTSQAYTSFLTAASNLNQAANAALEEATLGQFKNQTTQSLLRSMLKAMEEGQEGVKEGL